MKIIASICVWATVIGLILWIWGVGYGFELCLSGLVLYLVFSNMVPKKPKPPTNPNLPGKTSRFQHRLEEMRGKTQPDKEE